MNYQTVFKRYELKYLLTQAQRAQLLRAMSPYMALDSFGHSTIRNIYFDTDSYRLARRSIEQPAYKEKLRLRGYGEGGGDSTAFVELKMKYDSVVYKRRLSLPEEQAMRWLCGGSGAPVGSTPAPTRAATVSSTTSKILVLQPWLESHAAVVWPPLPAPMIAIGLFVMIILLFCF